MSGLTSFKELQQTQAITNKTIVTTLEKATVSPTVQKLTGWEKSAEIWKLVRQRKIDGEVVILDKDFLLAEIIHELPLEKAEDSIYEYFENELNLEIAYAKKEIEVEPVTKEMKDLMNLRPEDTHVIAVKSLVFLEDTRCFEYTESYHRLDKFRFVEFARRRKI